MSKIELAEPKQPSTDSAKLGPELGKVLNGRDMHCATLINVSIAGIFFFFFFCLTILINLDSPMSQIQAKTDLLCFTSYCVERLVCQSHEHIKRISQFAIGFGKINA